tara:strand:+ start:55 stop:261 length:207 start_codon:yes stop_codon:yes gene_type:complete
MHASITTQLHLIGMNVFLIKFWGDDTNLIREEKLEMKETQVIPYTSQIIHNEDSIIRATYEIYTPTKQ